MYWVCYTFAAVAILGFIERRAPARDYDDRLGNLVVSALLAFLWPLILGVTVLWQAFRRRAVIARAVRSCWARRRHCPITPEAD